jgi:hypothetical protein
MLLFELVGVGLFLLGVRIACPFIPFPPILDTSPEPYFSAVLSIPALSDMMKMGNSE